MCLKPCAYKLWLVMANEILENNTLPDLPNDLAGEQLVLKQKVFRKTFKLHICIKNWLIAHENDREYPVEFK